MAQKKQLRIDEFAGWQLTNAAFCQYMNSSLNAVLSTESDKINATTLTADLRGDLEQMTKLINVQQAYEQTSAVGGSDWKRDRTVTFIYQCIHFGNLLPETSYYYAAAHKLYVIASAYKSIAHHELTKESQEVVGFYNAVKNNAEAWEAAKTLGLQNAFTEMYNANVSVMNLIMEREQVMGERIAEKGGLKMDELRRDIWAEWCNVTYKVTSAYGYTEDEKLAVTITAVNGVVAHYRLVAANTGKSQKSSDPTPDDTTPDDPAPDDTTPDDTTPDDQTPEKE